MEEQKLLGVKILSDPCSAQGESHLAGCRGAPLPGASPLRRTRPPDAAWELGGLHSGEESKLGQDPRAPGGPGGVGGMPSRSPGSGLVTAADCPQR